MRQETWTWTLLLALTGSSSVSAEPLISEFLARNRSTLDDEDGDSSDWLEIHNPDAFRVELGGWYLTDDPADLRKWEFPAVALEPGGFLVVFASGKDRRRLAGELHTNFQLSSIGEYLALVRPDATVAHEYAPFFPEQKADISYGLGQAVSTRRLVPPDAAVRAHVPGDESLGRAWTGGAEPFDDSGWSGGSGGVGYVTSVSGFAARNYLSAGGVGSLAAAEDVIRQPALQSEVFAQNTAVIDYLGTNASGHYPLDNPFPGAEPGENVDNFVLEATATVTIPAPGLYTFGVLSDDGFSLVLTNGVDSFQIAHPDVRGPGDTVGTFDFARAGEYDLRLIFYERGGGSGVELYARPGRHTSWNSGFRLVGDTVAGGLAVRSAVVAGGSSPSLRQRIGLDVGDSMRGVQTAVYVRIPFALADPASLESLTLRAWYDDGFVAYLNGTEIARRNAPDVLRFDSRALVDRPGDRALDAVDIGVSEHLGLLVPGANVLAFQGLNDRPDSGDFLLQAELSEILVESMVAGYFDRASPGAANPEGFVDVVADTKFDVDRGFFTVPFDVAITSETEGAAIRYSLDGRAPDLQNGRPYQGPIRVDRTTILRAAAFREGFIPTNVDTQTYIFLADVVLQNAAATLDAGFPASWGGTSPDYGMDFDVIGPGGRDRYGGRYAATIADDLLAVPTISITADIDDLFGPRGIYTNSTSRGSAWERRASVELIFPDGTEGFRVNCGLRIHGGAFRSHGLTKKHSLRLLFKGIYGPTKLRYPLFGADAVDRFDTVVLRANSNDGWQWGAAGSKPLYVRDSFGRETVLAMGGVAPHEIFVHVYLNGIYWGLYDVVERPDASFSAMYFGGDKEEWDAVSNNSVSNGNSAAWNALRDRSQAGLASDAAFEAIQGNFPDGTDDPDRAPLLDVDNLIDYMITNLYVGNTDWPRKNYWVGHRRGPESGGFKFSMWDSEWSIGLRSDLGTNRTGVSAGVAVAYAAARANAEFRLRFADHVARHFFNGGALHVDPSRPQWDPEHPERNVPAARFAALTDLVERAVVAESARWGDQHSGTPYTRDEHWRPERDGLLRDYFPRRSGVVLGQFRAAGLYPSVDAPDFNQHGGRIEPGFELEMRATSGTIHYTLDGSDPRLRGGAVSPAARSAGAAAGTTLVSSGADVGVLVPGDGSLALEWTAVDFDDSGWLAGTTGVGYERSSGYEDLIATDVETLMHGLSSSVYLRIRFFVEDPAAFSFLTLRFKYDDGYVAYLNGVQVAARNAPAAPAWNSSARSSRSDGAAVAFEGVDITAAAAGVLQAGTNVLAIHGLNQSVTSSDLLLLPELDAAGVFGGEGVVLDGTTRVRARTLRGGEWSAMTEAVFVVDSSALRITEVMYNPPAPPPGSPFDNDDFEFIELQNTGQVPLSLLGMRLAGAVRFTFPEGIGQPADELEPGEVVVVVKNVEAFASRYDTRGLLIAGEYGGSLSNGGELLVLMDFLSAAILDFVYSDVWYPVTDGGGFSLEVVDPLAPGGIWRLREGWRPSADPGGSPGFIGDLPDGGFQRPGEFNQDGLLDISDPISLLRHLFLGSPAAPCEGEGVNRPADLRLLDANGDGAVDVSDPVHQLAYLFQDGPQHALGSRCVRLEGCPTSCLP
ncbi:MAG: lamin tail domain-containing protein [Planctomycetota bacterium]|nr:lamin tail domain-containing protein [Planctomycetota bacterium]